MHVFCPHDLQPLLELRHAGVHVGRFELNLELPNGHMSVLRVDLDGPPFLVGVKAIGAIDLFLVSRKCVWPVAGCSAALLHSRASTSSLAGSFVQETKPIHSARPMHSAPSQNSSLCSDG